LSATLIVFYVCCCYSAFVSFTTSYGPRFAAISVSMDRAEF